MINANIVKVGNKEIQIENSTRYNANVTLGQYVVGQGTTVEGAIAALVQKGMTEEVAAQSLFTRAVRTLEYEYYRNIVINMVSFDAQRSPFIAGLMFDLIIGFTDWLGFNAQYSV